MCNAFMLFCFTSYGLMLHMMLSTCFMLYASWLDAAWYRIFEACRSRSWSTSTISRWSRQLSLFLCRLVGQNGIERSAAVELVCCLRGLVLNISPRTPALAALALSVAAGTVLTEVLRT